MFKRINKKEALEKLSNANAILVDIRDTESFERGHIDEAIPLGQENIVEFVNNTNKDTPVLVICYHGNSSQMVAKYFAENGFSDVYSVDGGYEGWVNS
ncbi:MAG: thiosulfate sulfurtransferase GlpE [Bacteroidota bacterium]|jgi:thiosulfate sulfurtransferase